MTRVAGAAYPEYAEHAATSASASPRLVDTCRLHATQSVCASPPPSHESTPVQGPDAATGTEPHTLDRVRSQSVERGLKPFGISSLKQFRTECYIGYARGVLERACHDNAGRDRRVHGRQRVRVSAGETPESAQNRIVAPERRQPLHCREHACRRGIFQAAATPEPHTVYRESSRAFARAI